MNKKRNIVEWAMHYRQIVILITAVLVAFGMFALSKINKNEFPDFTVRQGVVVAVYPGATVNEMEEQVTQPLENYIFTYKEVKKEKTKSYTRNGLTIVQVELNDDIDGANKENFWSRFKLGVQQFKSSLPSGVGSRYSAGYRRDAAPNHSLFHDQQGRDGRRNGGATRLCWRTNCQRKQACASGSGSE